VAVLVVYGPALSGPFLFDDLYLPFTAAEFANAGVRTWVSGLRPALMLSFWGNFRLSGMEPFSYHLFNVLCHCLNGVLIFLAVRKLLAWAGAAERTRDPLAGFAAALFLLHPLQTESVAYVASRSEVLSVMFYLAAFNVFLYRRRAAASFPVSIAVVLLFAAAVSTKEHTASLPLALLLTDYWFNPGFSFAGIRKNWRLYGLMAAGAAVVIRPVWRLLRTADTAGFALKDLPWHHYFFTQGRAIWQYIRLFLLPWGQNVDPDFPVSRTLLDHGALFGLLGLAALAAAAVWGRRRFPLASYGFLLFLLLLAPTSSVMPIADPLAERRLYLPMIGLLLAAMDFLRRWKAPPRTVAAAMVALLVVEGALAHRRNEVWSSDLALWTDSVAKSPNKSRPHFQLGFAYFSHGRCAEALAEYQTAARLSPPEYRLLTNLGMAHGCLDQWAPALEEFRQAQPLRNGPHVWALIGLAEAKLGHREQALAAFDTAEKLGAAYDTTYAYRGDLYAAAGDWAAADREYRRALALNPGSELALRGAAAASQHLSR
jgi:tetratricopeptide (TPR) repeat protein